MENHRSMQTKEFEELWRGLAVLSPTDRITGYIERCNKMTPKQKAKVLVDLFDNHSRNDLLRRLFGERRYAQAGIVCIYQNAIEEQLAMQHGGPDAVVSLGEGPNTH